MEDMTGEQGALLEVSADDTAPTVVARVLVDVDLPHLDHPLDYTVPDQLAAQAQVGCLVRVRLGGAKHLGWIVGLAASSDHPGRLSPLLSVVSDTPVVSPEILGLARYIADRTVSTASQALSLAVPARHAATEREVLAEEAPPPAPVRAPDVRVWGSHPGGGALVRHLEQGDHPRAVWTALPGSRDAQMAQLVAATRAAGRSVVVVLPTASQVALVRDAFTDLLGAGTFTCVTSEDTPATRYRTHLEALAGRVSVVVGTRSAVWTPVRALGLVIVWDDGDDRLQEQRAPRVSALDVAVARAHLEGAALVAGAFSRSVKAHALVRSGWAVSVVARRDARRAGTPRVHVPDEADREREGPAGESRLPPRAQQLVRRHLAEGPVLIQVPTAGYVPVISCEHCRRVARCARCGGTLSLHANRRVACEWCGRGTEDWRCPQCAGTQVRAVRVGSDRTGEELGRAFPGVPLTVSSSTRSITRTIGPEARLVVATPGAEPVATGGYATALILDAPAIAGRPELWAPEEALRRWFNALALVRPEAQAAVLGGVEPVLAQTLIRWDPADFADRALDERAALGFFPVTTIVALDGPADDVAQMAAETGAEVLGTVVRPPGRDRPGPPQSAGDGDFQDGGAGEVRTLLRAPHDRAPDLLASLARLQQHRASRRLPMVRITVNPPELF